MKCMNEKGLEAYQVKKNLKNLGKSLRTKIEVRLECFGERNREVSRERSNGMRSRSRRALYRKASNSRQMQVSTGIERFVEEVSRKYMSTAEVLRRYRGSTHQF